MNKSPCVPVTVPNGIDYLTIRIRFPASSRVPIDRHIILMKSTGNMTLGIKRFLLTRIWFKSSNPFLLVLLIDLIQGCEIVVPDLVDQVTSSSFLNYGS